MKFQKFSKETGANLYEYLVIMLFLVVGMIPSVTYFGQKTNAKFEVSVDAWERWVVAPGEGG